MQSTRITLKKHLTTISVAAVIAILVPILSLVLATWTFYLNSPNADFSVQVSNLEGTVAPGGSNSTVIIVSAKDLSLAMSLFNQRTGISNPYQRGNVMLTASLNNTTAQPLVSITLRNADDSPNPTYSSQLNVVVDNGTPPGDYPITITALSSFGTVHTCQYLLHVTNPAAFDLEFTGIYQPNGIVTDPSWLQFNSPHFEKGGQEVNVSLDREFYVNYSVTQMMSGQHVIIAINPHNNQTWYAALNSQPEPDGSWSAGPFNASNMSRLPGKDRELKYTIAAVAVNDTVYAQLSALKNIVSTNVIPIQLISSYQLLSTATFKGNGY